MHRGSRPKGFYTVDVYGSDSGNYKLTVVERAKDKTVTPVFRLGIGTQVISWEIKDDNNNNNNR